MANKKAVLSKPLPDASLPRNAFDRGYELNCHSSVGMLLPVFCEPVIAGSQGKINRSIFQRTTDVNTAAFATLDTHIDFFYVRMEQLFSRWDDFKLNIQDINNSATAMYNSNDPYAMPSPSSPVTVPQFNLSHFDNANNDYIYRQGLATYNFKDGIGYTAEYGARRLLDLLGYGNYYKTTQDCPNLLVNTFKLQAYQKVYYDHYRNTAYETNNPFYYNLDDLLNDGASYPWIIPDVRVAMLSRLQYVNYRNDYFQNLYPSITYTQSVPTGGSWLVPDNIPGVINGISDPNVFGVNNYVTPNSVQVTRTQNANSIYPQLSISTLRSAFALDKLLRSSAYAPKHAKDQYEARYGIKYPVSPFESVRLGSFKNDITLQEVVSTVETSNQPLGTIGAKGQGFNPNGDTITFTAPKDGIIIGVMYTLPRASYDSTFLMQWNMKDSREDFFVPEFMDLGLQPVDVRNYNMNHVSANQANILGYQPRYQEYKIGIDRNCGLFASYNGNQLKAFTNHTNVANQNGIDQNGGVTNQFFKVDPASVNDMFVAQYSDTADPWLNDQLLTNIRFNFIVNQNMSVHGQPKLSLW